MRTDETTGLEVEVVQEESRLPRLKRRTTAQRPNLQKKKSPTIRILHQYTKVFW